MLSCFKKTEKGRFFQPHYFEIKDLRDLIQTTLKSLAPPVEDFTDYAYKYHFLELLLESFNKEAVREMDEEAYDYYKTKVEAAISGLNEHMGVANSYKVKG